MDAKKFFVGGLILSAMFINSSPAFADDELETEVEIFGSEFEDFKEFENVPPPEQQTQPEPQQTQPEPQQTQPEVDRSLEQENIPPTEPSNTQNFEDDWQGDSQLPVTTTQPETDVTTSSSKSKTAAQKKLSMQKLRFFKLTMDSNYIYYLDKDTVRWLRMPYSTTEMMADVWVRMIPRDDTDLLMPSQVDDIILAKEEGKQFQPEDVEVLCHKQYHLEHYYLRPKTRQIQYLVELSDIEGNPQNTVNQRTYSYSNWEDLIPNSIEYRIYNGVIKIIGKGRSLDDPVTFADMVEEYARISIR